jgi:hypothetical protein
MSTSGKVETSPEPIAVRVSRDTLSVDLADGTGDLRPNCLVPPTSAWQPARTI